MERDENKQNIEDEIMNVNLLCGKIENYVKNGIVKSNNSNLLQKPNVESFSGSNKKNLKSSLKKNGKGRTNLSMDDKMLKDMNYPTVIEKHVKNPSVDTKNLSKKVNLKNMIDKTKIETKKNQVNTNTNFETVLNRFKECEISRINKINEKKKEVEFNLIKEVKNVPDIDKNSRKIVSGSEDFITRQEKFLEDCEKKKNALKEKSLEQKQKILDEEEKILNSLKGKKLDKEEIDKKIITMYEWDAQRKTKIEKLKEREPVYSFKPAINKNSSKMVSSQKPSDSEGELINRLYKQEIIKRKQKKEILEDLYKPKFVPDLTLSHNYKTIETEAKDSTKSKSKSKKGKFSKNEHKISKTEGDASPDKAILENSD